MSDVLIKRVLHQCQDEIEQESKHLSIPPVKDFKILLFEQPRTGRIDTGVVTLIILPPQVLRRGCGVKKPLCIGFVLALTGPCSSMLRKRQQG